MSDNLFRRSWKVQVDTLDVSALDIEFKILSTIKPQPNKCSLTVWNMNQDHRAQLLKRNQPGGSGSKIAGVPVQVEAGYIDNTSVIFSGDLREVSSINDVADWKTILAGDDGGRAYREGRINQTFKAGTPISNILSQCASAMGIGLGNVSNFEASAYIAGIGTTLAGSMTFSGSARDALDRIIKSLGLVWSIQKGALQVQAKGKPLDLGAILISPRTGLIGSPEASIDSTVSLGNPQQFAPGAAMKVPKPPKPKDPGIIKFKSLLIPGLVPGRKIVMESQQFNGGYAVTETEAIGQTFGNDWYFNCVARVY